MSYAKFMNDFNAAYSELKIEKSKIEKEIAAMLDAFEKKYAGVTVKKLKLQTDNDYNNDVTIKLDFNA